MKFLKPLVIILTLVALSFTVSAGKISFNKEVKQSVKVDIQKQADSLPVHGDLLFAFTAIASLGAYMVFKK